MGSILLLPRPVVRSCWALIGAAWVASAFASPLDAQCQAWSPSFRGNGTDQPVLAFALHDDGAGPALFCGGSFTRWGDTPSFGVARWDGQTWSGLGGGVTGGVQALASFDAGGGPILYAGGALVSAGGQAVSNIARWNGSSWSAVGLGVTGGSIEALAVYDDGSGPDLYAAGSFTMAGGAPAASIARWDGSVWSTLGAGIQGVVHSLRVYDDGTGAALYAGGNFTGAGGAPANSVAKWDGSAWSTLGSGITGQYRTGVPPTIFDMVVHDDGGGPELCVAGSFTSAGGNPADRAASWDGASWTALDLVVPGDAFSIGSYDDGTGALLAIGGQLPTSGIRFWNGTSWANPATTLWADVRAMETYNAGNGPLFFLGGDLIGTDAFVAEGLVGFDGQDFVPVVSGPDTQGLGGFPGTTASALTTFDSGAGEVLVAGGNFPHAGIVPSPGLAFWDGASWSSANLVGEVATTAARSIVLGGTPWLVVGGDDFVKRRSGAGPWQQMTFTNAPVLAIESHDFGSGTNVYIGGSFSSPSNGIADWNGAGLGSGMNGAVNALAVFDDGGGAALYAGGTFTTADGVPASYVARWDGSSWSSVGGGMNGIVNALVAHDDGSGPKLYAGGSFTTAGGVPAVRVACWDGSSWAPIGAGFDDVVRAITFWDDGNGSALYAGGHFQNSGAQPVRRLARWNGATWTEVGGGLGGIVRALHVYDDGSGGGPDLYAAGGFLEAGGLVSNRIARWDGCAVPGTRMCFGDGSLATPCPCGNFGATGHGCQNSSLTGGATLGSSGTTVPDTVVLFASGERPTALTIFLQGAQVTNSGLVFGDGLRCASGTLKRLYVKNAVGGAVSAPTPGDPSITARSSALGDPIAPGARRYYQTYYRDSNLTFCPAPAGNTFNSSNAVKIVW